MKRRLDNFEGAFPLLVIGSVLLVYAAIIAGPEIGTKGHLPLWGLIAGVGAVIVGAGIYSTFLEPATAETAPSTKDWVTVPRSEWDSLRAGRVTGGARFPRTEEPAWWEGPPVPPAAPISRRTRPEIYREPERPIPRPSKLESPLSTPVRPSTAIAGGRASAIPPRAPTREPPRVGPSLPIYRKGSLEDLERTVSEIEALVNGQVSLAPGRPPRAVSRELLLCADCDRHLPQNPAPVRCTGCGAWMCARCAASSRSEDGELRCIACRVREP